MTPEARAARERKQKIFVAVGGVVLLGLLAFQLPKILGGSSTSEAASTTTTPVAATPGTAPPSSTPASLGDTTPLPAVTGTKLRSFSVFAKKDPFVQQVVAPSDASPTEATSSGSGTGGGKQQETPGDGKVPSQGFTTGDKPAASVTVIRVNGTAEALATGAAFPSVSPVFVLVAEQQKQKTVTIGIAGGAYASGARTIKLKVGKPLVLENTATGAKYKLVLVSVGSGAAAPSAAPAPQPPSPPVTP